MIRAPNLILMVALLAFAGVAFSESGESSTESATSDKTLVIAHRGASGYLPEHTIAAKAMAYGQGADYIEQDLVMTKDDKIVVLHDQHLDTVTDVAEQYPDRHRNDGRYYVIDFTMDEIRTLNVSERFEQKNGDQKPVFSERFPLGKSTFKIHEFADEIELVQGLNKSTGRSVGIYPEIKSPKYHLDEGKDISAAVLAVLKSYGYTAKLDRVFLQCFDEDELRRIHGTLMPEQGMDLRLVQLMGTEKEYRWMLGEGGMEKVAAYADGIGPSILLLINPKSKPPDIEATPLVADAHAAGLVVHPYTFRRERQQMPPFSKNYADFLRLFIDELGVDGVFTDFTDLTVEYIESER